MDSGWSASIYPEALMVPREGGRGERRNTGQCLGLALLRCHHLQCLITSKYLRKKPTFTKKKKSKKEEEGLTIGPTSPSGPGSPISPGAP